MPTIIFDVLIPTVDSDGPEKVRDSFALALKILVEQQRLDTATVERVDDPQVSTDIISELEQVYHRDHPGTEIDDFRIYRYEIDATGPAMSYNELAMALSRILNPKTALPSDPLKRIRQQDFERPAIYPWTVEIRR